MPQHEARIPVLDGVRGLAVLLVLIHHGLFYFPASGAEALFLKLGGGWDAWGWIGVDLFFVLSGYLITGILLDSRRRPGYFRNFYARRTLRIFPLYFMSLAVAFFVLPLFAADLTGVPARERVWFWTYTSNFYYSVQNRVPIWMSHFWSLCVEEHFYLAWPFVVYAAGDRIRPICLGLIAAMASLRLGLSLAGVKPLALYCLTATRIDTLAMGALLAAQQRSPGGLLAVRRHLAWGAVGLAAAVATLGALTSGLHALSPRVIRFGLSAVGLWWMCLLGLIVTGAPGGLLSRVFNRAELGFLGKYSYGLYVIHMPVLAYLQRALSVADDLGNSVLPLVFGSQIPMALVQLGAMLLGSGALAFASYHLYEKHFLALKRYFAHRPAASPVPAYEPPVRRAG